MSFPNDVKSIIFFGKSNLELYFSAIPYSFKPDSLQVPYSLSPDWALIGHSIFKTLQIRFGNKIWVHAQTAPRRSHSWRLTRMRRAAVILAAKQPGLLATSPEISFWCYAPSPEWIYHEYATPQTRRIPKSNNFGIKIKNLSTHVEKHNRPNIICQSSCYQ